MKTICEIYKEGMGWVLECTSNSVTTCMDGYRSKIDAQYAMRVKLWGGPFLTPLQAEQDRPDGWMP